MQSGSTGARSNFCKLSGSQGIGIGSRRGALASQLGSKVEVRFDDDGLLGESGASGESVVSDNVSASCRSMSDRRVWEEDVEAVSESESLGGYPEPEVLSVSMVFTSQ